jgi:hypothetical protein
MTKHEEIETLRKFVAGLPRDSYVRDALEPFLLEFERGVYSDYVPSVFQSWEHRLEAEMETKEARAALKAVEDEIKKAKARLRNYSISVGTLLDRSKQLQQGIDGCVESLREVHEASNSLYERTVNL